MKFGADKSFSDIDAPKVVMIQEYIISTIDPAFELLRAEARMSLQKQRETDVARELIRVHRYGDAKEHCLVYGLSYGDVVEFVTGKKLFKA
ncbi:MAG: hypothetical protein WCP15_01785 [bacterium]